LAEVARRLAAAGLAAVDPARLVAAELARREGPFTAALAIGKAAAAMARGAGAALALTPRARRLLVRPHTSPALRDPAWEELSGGHPLPDEGSLAAGARLRRWLSELSGDDRLLALVSGGASACLELPARGLALEDLVAVQRTLQASGLPIEAVNAVRKHLSQLKGGGALRASRGRVLALLLSDVPGDDPAVIASGPFTADPTSYRDALAALVGLDVPQAVLAHLEDGAARQAPETLAPGDPDLARVETVLLAGVRTAPRAAAEEARRMGFLAEEGDLTGEAAAAAEDLVARGRRLGGGRAALLMGGETTVTLGLRAGRGGRNQELALAAARVLAGSPDEVVLALATDGEDGTTGVAGAIVDGTSWGALARAGIDPARALARHDSHTALAALPQALVATGPTGTNVADFGIYLRRTG
jgi:glycerate 2-kinase